MLREYLRKIRLRKCPRKEGRVGGLQVDHDGEVVRRLDRCDLPEGGARETRILAADLGERVRDVGGGERTAVVPGHATFQLERVFQPIRTRGPRLGKARSDIELGVHPDQRVVDLAGDADGQDVDADPGQKMRRVVLNRDDERAAFAHTLLRPCRAGGQQQRRRRETGNDVPTRRPGASSRHCHDCVHST